MDERITANEWNKRRECPICRDIADHKVNLEGEIVTDDKTGEAVPCPQCGHRDTRIFHSVGGVEGKKSSSRGDTQIWNHLIRGDNMDDTIIIDIKFWSIINIIN